MAEVDLIRLLDLSLGDEPCGVVNFNYLHAFLHEVVRRLHSVEDCQYQILSIPTSYQVGDSSQGVPTGTNLGGLPPGSTIAIQNNIQGVVDHRPFFKIDFEGGRYAQHRALVEANMERGMTATEAALAALPGAVAHSPLVLAGQGVSAGPGSLSNSTSIGIVGYAGPDMGTDMRTAGTVTDPRITGTVGIGVDPMRMGVAGMGMDPTRMGTAGTGMDPTKMGAVGTGMDPTQMGTAGTGMDPTKMGAVGTGMDPTQMGTAGTGMDPAKMGAVGTGMDPTQMGTAGTEMDPTRMGTAGTGMDPATMGTAGTGMDPTKVGAVGTGMDPTKMGTAATGMDPTRMGTAGTGVDPSGRKTIGVVTDALTSAPAGPPTGGFDPKVGSSSTSLPGRGPGSAIGISDHVPSTSNLRGGVSFIDGDSTDTTPSHPSTKTSQARIPGHSSTHEGTHSSSSSSVSTRPSSRRKSTIVSAAIDLGALEKKLFDLEGRINTIESVPEMLERKGSDSTITPVRDMWNFANLTNRIASAENGVDKTTQIVDDLIGEIQALKQLIASLQNDLADRLDGMDQKITMSAENFDSKLKQLEGLKLTSDSPSDAFAALAHSLQEKITNLETESKEVKIKVESLEGGLGDCVTSSQFSELSDTVKERHTQTSSLLEELQERVRQFEESQSRTNTTVEDRANQMQDLINKLNSAMEEMQSSLSSKVNASDLASLMPSEPGDSAGVMPKLLELQAKFNSLEEQLAKRLSLPPDLLDKISVMQDAIDRLSADVSKFSGLLAGSADAGKLEDISSELARIKERMEDFDRGLAILSEVLADRPAVPQIVEESTGQQVDANAFNSLQELVNQLGEQHNRLMGTVANLSHEQDVNQEHIKTLYSNTDSLEQNKVDREQLAVEVEEKADRRALDGKASREWVDSTFERLDREIREAKSRLMGQEEAFRSTMTQINEDVDGKLDRMELEPLKDYFDKKISRIKTAPVPLREEAGTDDAAGVRKPLRFRCISCDKPVGLRPQDPIPTLPSVEMLPGTRTFRPFTTYELEMIRRHQKVGHFGMLGQQAFPASIRSAGGSHTRTHATQRIRMTPFTVAPTPEPQLLRPSIHEEVDIIGHNGQIYKGRSTRSSLPPIQRPRSEARIPRGSRGRPAQSVF